MGMGEGVGVAVGGTGVGVGVLVGVGVGVAVGDGVGVLVGVGVGLIIKAVNAPRTFSRFGVSMLASGDDGSCSKARTVYQLEAVLRMIEKTVKSTAPMKQVTIIREIKRTRSVLILILAGNL